MEPKKNPVHDVHQYRPVIFGISLIASLCTVIIVFEWSVQKIERIPIPDELVLAQLIPIEYPPHNFTEELPKQAKRVNPDRIIEVKHDPVVQTDEPLIVMEPAPDVNAMEPVYYEEPTAEVAEEDTFRIAEFMPLPEGGYEGFYKLLGKKMKYPSKAQRNHTQGKVFVEFTVDKTGSVSNVKILKGLGDGCDEEAMRVLALAKWRPGKQRGVPVNVRMVQTIEFRLQ
jgi:protein TonB